MKARIRENGANIAIELQFFFRGGRMDEDEACRTQQPDYGSPAHAKMGAITLPATSV
ncbi:uncharacterized protein METZ01_LOCUS507895, partial [marine metagenome]